MTGILPEAAPAVSHPAELPEITRHDLDEAAHESAFGSNARPEPTDGQLLAGNYKKGRGRFGAFSVVIENPRDTFRSGVGREGPWCQRMPAHYGYFPGTTGHDGDEVDVFVGPHMDDETAYVINQDLGGRFDEHKVVLGAGSEPNARALYLGSYQPGWKGLHSIVACSHEQLRWWLRNGDMSRRLAASHLPAPGTIMTKKIFWDSACNPVDTTLPRLMYSLRESDTGHDLLLDPMTAGELDDALGASAQPLFDGIVSTSAMLAKKMAALMRIMKAAASPEVEPVSVDISEPKLRKMLGGNTVNVDVIFTLADGQTVTIAFHNPDSTPTRLLPSDELISWKWLLNKRDVTIVVAPERGSDLNVREVARRIALIAQKNHGMFARVSASKEARAQRLVALRAEESELDGQLAELEKQIDAARFKLEEARNTPKRPAGSLTIDEARQRGVDAFAAGARASSYKDEVLNAAVAVEPEMEAKLRDAWMRGFESARDLAAAGTLPEGWSESRPGGLATNPDPVRGGIIDENKAGLGWFVIFHEDALTPIKGLPTRKAAFEAFAAAMANLDAERAPKSEPAVEVQAAEQHLPVEETADAAPRTVDSLPDGWTEDGPGATAMNLDPVLGGVIDHNDEGWFVKFNNDAIPATLERLPSRAAAFDAFAGAVNQFLAAQALPTAEPTQEPIVAVSTEPNPEAAAELAAALAQAEPPPGVPAEPLTEVAPPAPAEPVEIPPAPEPPPAVDAEVQQEANPAESGADETTPPANEQEPTESATPEPAPEEAQAEPEPPSPRELDIAYLKDVQSGAVDYHSPEITERIEEIYVRHADDVEIEALVMAAVDAYQTYVSASAGALLAAA